MNAFRLTLCLFALIVAGCENTGRNIRIRLTLNSETLAILRPDGRPARIVVVRAAPHTGSLVRTTEMATQAYGRFLTADFRERAGYRLELLLLPTEGGHDASAPLPNECEALAAATRATIMETDNPLDPIRRVTDTPADRLGCVLAY